MRSAIFAIILSAISFNHANAYTSKRWCSRFKKDPKYRHYMARAFGFARTLKQHPTLKDTIAGGMLLQQARCLLFSNRREEILDGMTLVSILGKQAPRALVRRYTNLLMQALKERSLPIGQLRQFMKGLVERNKQAEIYLRAAGILHSYGYTSNERVLKKEAQNLFFRALAVLKKDGFLRWRPRKVPRRKRKRVVELLKLIKPPPNHPYNDHKRIVRHRKTIRFVGGNLAYLARDLMLWYDGKSKTCCNFFTATEKRLKQRLVGAKGVFKTVMKGLRSGEQSWFLPKVYYVKENVLKWMHSDMQIARRYKNLFKETDETARMRRILSEGYLYYSLLLHALGKGKESADALSRANRLTPYTVRARIFTYKLYMPGVVTQSPISTFVGMDFARAKALITSIKRYPAVKVKIGVDVPRRWKHHSRITIRLLSSPSMLARYHLAYYRSETPTGKLGPGVYEVCLPRFNTCKKVTINKKEVDIYFKVNKHGKVSVSVSHQKHAS